MEALTALTSFDTNMMVGPTTVMLTACNSAVSQVE